MSERYPPRSFWWLAAAGLALTLLLTGCSAGGNSGNSNISLGLAGSTADQPSAPPAIATNGPDDTYAFVYHDQVWVHQQGTAAPAQITHLVLSNGADISFGPLAWSPDGTQIAFALVQNLAPSSPSRTDGPIYVVSIKDGTTVVTPGIGSIYGHSYAWYGLRMLFYASGNGISMYDVGDPDPRVWPVISGISSQDGDVTFSGSATFGDIATIAGNSLNGQLFYSAAEISNLGSTGAMGTVGLYRETLPSLAAYNAMYTADHSNTEIAIPEWLYENFPPGGTAFDQYLPLDSLGQAYSDTLGNITMGSWQLSSDGITLVYQDVSKVDATGQTVSSNFCAVTASRGYSGCQAVLSSAGTCPQSVHGQLSLSSNAQRVAYTCNALYVQNTSGGGDGKLDAVGWTTPAAMNPAGTLTVGTKIVSSSTDSSGVVRIQTDLVAFSGSNSYVLVHGAESASWQ